MTKLQHLEYLEAVKNDYVMDMAKAVIANDAYKAKCLQSAIQAKEEKIAKYKKQWGMA